MKSSLFVKVITLLSLCSALCVSGAGAAVVPGNLNGASPTWNRISDRAGNPDSSNDGLPYQLLEIRSATGGALTATVTATTQFDSFLALYSSSGSLPGSPAANLLVADDDSGGYPNAQLSRSGLAANTSYYLVVTSYSNQAGSVYPLYGNYTLTLSGDFRVVAPNIPPTLGGTYTTNGALNDTATSTPFSGVSVADANNDNVTVTITYAAANGTLTGTGLTGSAGNYTLTSGSVATVTNNLHGLVFHPTANQTAPGSTVVTSFTLTPGDGSLTGAADSSTKMTVTSVNDAPTNSVVPGVSGTTKVGSLVIGSSGSWSDVDPGASLSYSYQWYRADTNLGANSAAITGATGSSRTLTTADAHKFLRLTVTANDGQGSSNQTASSSWTSVVNSAPVNTTAPVISGTATVGSLLTATSGTWTDADSDTLTYGYQWYRADDGIGTNEVAISGATANTYTVTTGDKYLRVVVTANDGHGSTDQTATSNRTVVVHQISASASQGGSISPSGSVTVADNTTRQFDFSADPGFTFTGITGTCPVGSVTATSFTTGAITGNCSVTANFADQTGPAIILSTLPNGAITIDQVLNLAGSVSDVSGLAAFTINGVDLLSQADDFSHVVVLAYGANIITITASDSFSNTTTITRNITYDPVNPGNAIMSPSDLAITERADFEVITDLNTVGNTIQVAVIDPVTNSITDSKAGVATDYGFSASVALANPLNTILITVTDPATGASSSRKRTIFFRPTKPSLAVNAPRTADTFDVIGAIALSGDFGNASEPLTILISKDDVTFTAATTVTGDGTGPSRFYSTVELTEAKTWPITVRAVKQSDGSVVAQVRRHIVYTFVGPVTSPTPLTTQIITGIMASGATVSGTSATATIGAASYPTFYPAATLWSLPISGLAAGANVITITISESGKPNRTQTVIIVQEALAVTITPSVASPHVAGTAVQFNAACQNGSDGYQYRFHLYDGTNWTLVQDYGGGASWSLPAGTPAGNYVIAVDVRTSSAVDREAVAYLPYQITTTVITPATGVTVTPALASPRATGTAVRFDAAGQNGSGGYQYRFHLYNGTSWTLVQDYGVATSWTLPAATLPGNYVIAVEVRTSSAVDRDAIAYLSYQITATAITPATGVIVTPALTSPQATGTAVQFAAAGQNGSGGYQYRFYLYNGSSWTLVQDYGVGASWTLPAATPPGDYVIAVDVRTSSAVDRDAVAYYPYRIGL